MEHRAYTGKDPGNLDIEYLIEVWEDGTATIAFRDLMVSRTWGPPHDLTPA